ncbi:MAG: ATP-binding protein [Bacteroidota bacterium]|nr:ATP-binding protein [Bacteroidota bacterium]
MDKKKSDELAIANKKLVFQKQKKKDRAAELAIANKELVFQNKEKENRAAELVIANMELLFQNEEKENRAAELIIANKELLAFTYISSHDLQEPLRKIKTFVTILPENKNLSDKGKYNFQRRQLAAHFMQQLIDDLLAFSRINSTDHTFEKTNLNIIVEEVKNNLRDTIRGKKASIEIGEMYPANIITFKFRQLMYNLISNALKFSKPDIPSHITIKSSIVKGAKLNTNTPACLNSYDKDQLVQEKFSPGKNYWHTSVSDNGIGFEPHFGERIFGVFQKLDSKEIYAGTGIGLAIVKKIVENHNGIIIATSELKKRATVYKYIPAN